MVVMGQIASDAAIGASYAYGPARVEVRADAPDLVHWLDDFFLPGCSRSPVRAGDPRVTVVGANDPEALTHAGTVTDAGRQPCFALDRGVVSHPSGRTRDGVLVVDDGQYGTRSLLTRDGVTVVRTDPAPRSRAGVMRVVRELVTAQAVTDGQVQLHAALLERDGRVAVIAGPKEAGKTTLVARLAGLGVAALAANDRVLLASDDRGAWQAHAVGTIVSIRPRTRELLPALRDAFPDVASPAHLTDAELAAAGTRPAPADARVKVSPAQFANAIGARRAGGGRIARIVLLAVDPQLDGYRLRPLATDPAGRALRRAEYGNRPDGLPRTVFEDWLGVAPPSASDVWPALAHALPVSTLAVSPRVLHDDACAAALADLLFADA